VPRKVPTFRPRSSVPTYQPPPSVPSYQPPRENTRHRAFINSPAWRKCSASYLRRHPCCADCEAEGELTPATETHHTRGQDPEYYFDESTFLALCHRHHSRRTLEEQRHINNRSEAPEPVEDRPCNYG
jgi:hypothetical protein